MRSPERLRIAPAVHSFVVAANQRQHVTEGFQRQTDCLAAGGVAKHDLPFRLGQLSRLEEDAIGNSDFSDIM